MKIRMVAALLATAGGMLGSRADAAVIETRYYSGSMCHYADTVAASNFSYNPAGSVINNHTGTRTLICPVPILHPMTSTTVSAELTTLTTCTLRIVTPSGVVISTANDTGASVLVTGTGVPGAVPATANLRCEMGTGQALLSYTVQTST